MNASLAGRTIAVGGFSFGLVLLIAGNPAWLAVVVFILFAALAAAYRRWGVPMTWFKVRAARLVTRWRKSTAVADTKTGAAVDRA